MGKKKQDDVRISFLLDRTGSMAGVKSDVIGGFNSFLEEQRKEPGACRFTLTLFDSQSIDTESFDSVADVPELTEASYIPRAMTPLLDAMGRVIGEVDALPPAKRTLVVVYTDGLENASREFTKAKVKELVEAKQKDGWDFIFLGADIDAYNDAGSVGVMAGSTVSTNSAQTGATMDSLSASVSSYRQGDARYMSHLKAEEKKQRKVKSKS